MSELQLDRAWIALKKHRMNALRESGHKAVDVGPVKLELKGNYPDHVVPFGSKPDLCFQNWACFACLIETA